MGALLIHLENWQITKSRAIERGESKSTLAGFLNKKIAFRGLRKQREAFF